MAQQQLDDGKQASDVIRELTHKLSQYLMHAPTKALNTAIERNDTELKQTLIDAFELDQTISKKE